MDHRERWCSVGESGKFVVRRQPILYDMVRPSCVKFRLVMFAGAVDDIRLVSLGNARLATN